MIWKRCDARLQDLRMAANNLEIKMGLLQIQKRRWPRVLDALSPQDAPEDSRKPQEALGSPRKPQEAPGSPRRLQEVPGRFRKP